MNGLWIVAIAPLAVAGLIYLVYRLGGTATATLGSENEAVARLVKDYPDWTGREVHIAANGHMAVLPSDGVLGLVFAVGDVFATRVLEPGDIEIANDDAKVHLHDFSAPDVALTADLAALPCVQPFLTKAGA